MAQSVLNRHWDQHRRSDAFGGLTPASPRNIQKYPEAKLFDHNIELLICAHLVPQLPEMDRNAFIAYVGDGHRVCAVKLVGLLCNYNEKVAAKTLQSKLAGPTLRQVVTISADDGKTLLVDKAVAAQLIMKLPEGNKGLADLDQVL